MPKPVTGVEIRDPEILLTALKVRGMSLRGLARAVDCHPSMIDHLVHGRKLRVEMPVATRIARTLRVRTRVLFIMPPVECQSRDQSRGASRDRASVGPASRPARHRAILRAEGSCASARAGLAARR